MTPFEQYESLLQEAKILSAKYLLETDTLVRDLSDRLRDQRIQIMLYGAYNAGKSTLLNALLGSEQARVADVPTTGTVTPYDWTGHILLDTPGVNAPIKHEEISFDALKRADLILFILRQEDQDAEDLMDRLFDLLEAKRSVFLLLNYSDSDLELIAKVRQHLNDTLIHYAQRRHFDLEAVGKIPVVLMNARTALKARLENKDGLRKHAGYDDFIQRFTDWLRQYDNETKRLQQAREVIERLFLDPVQKRIDEKSVSKNESGELEHEIEHLKREIRILKDAIANRLRFELAQHRPELAAVIVRGSDEISIIAEVKRIGATVEVSVRSWLEQEFPAHMQYSDGNSFFHKNGLDVHGIDQSDKDSWFDKNKGMFVDVAKKGASKENITELLKAGRRLKIPFLKGRWESTLGRWAGKAAPAIQIMLSGLEIFAAHNDEQKANQQQLNFALQQNQWVEEICVQIRDIIQDGLNEELTLVMDEGLQPLKNKLQILCAESSEIERDRADWSSLITRFYSVRF
jgi:GTPase SAR1 family protein